MAKFAVIFTLTLAAVSVCGRNLSRCEGGCKLSLVEPVCGYNGEEYRMFLNKCLMFRANCQGEFEWTSQSMERCEEAKSRQKRSNDCPVICPLYWDVVCATDGKDFKIFDNDCMLKYENCNSTKKWTRTRLNACRR